MINAILTGGLGNQMFQYAYARKLQHDRKDSLCLYLGAFQKDSLRDYALGGYKLNDQIEIESGFFPWYFDEFNNVFIRVIHKISPTLSFNLFKDFGYLFYYKRNYQDISKYLNKKNIYLSGIWQCTQYFDDIKLILKNDFSLKYELNQSVTLTLKRIRNVNSVCIHIRRGDYINSSVHEICRLAYYEAGIRKMEEKIEKPVFFVFSDDIRWTKEHLLCNSAIEFIEDINSDIDEMFLMRNCQHFIISNSSFSWWAQFLCDNPSKIVIAPNEWYIDRVHPDLYLPEWELIDVYSL